MLQEILEAKSALKALVDAFSNLADEKRIPDQMLLLTPDTRVQVYMGDELLVDIAGTQQVEETFTAFAANMKRFFHVNGQQVVEIGGDSATGIAYCQVKHVQRRGRSRGDHRQQRPLRRRVHPAGSGAGTSTPGSRASP